MSSIKLSSVVQSSRGSQMETVQRFSQIYLERGAPSRDSDRFRNRLSAYYLKLRINKVSETLDYRFTGLLETELGIHVPSNSWGSNPEKVFEKGELRDVLDAITLLYLTLARDNIGRHANMWRDFVARVMREENIGLNVDECCIVHYHVDEEFERNRASTLVVLDGPIFANVRAAFEDAYRHLDSDPQDTKAAVRSMFEALEIVAKQLCPGQKNLNRWLAQNTLKDTCLATMPQDPTERTVSSGMFDSLGEWVHALHSYRHGQPADIPVAPSLELATYALSTGSSHLRMLTLCLLRQP